MNALFEADFNIDPPQFEIPPVFQSLYENLRQGFENIQNSLFSFGTWIYEAVSRALDPVRQFISQLVSWLWEKVANAIDFVSSAVKNGLEWVGEKVWGFVNWLWGQVDGGLKWVYGGIMWIKDLIWSWIDGGLKWLWEKIYGSWCFLQNIVNNSLKWVSERVADAIDIVNKNISSVSAFIIDWFHKNVLDPIGDFFKPVIDFLHGIWDGMMNWFNNALNVFQEWVWNAVQFFLGLMNAAVGLFKDAFTSLARSIFDSITAAVSPHSPPEDLSKAVSVTYQALYQRLLERVESAYHSPVMIEGIQAVALGIATDTAIAGAAGQAVATAADQAHPLKNPGLQRLARSIIDMLRIPVIAGTPFLIMLETGVFRPLRYYYNSYFKPYIPDEDKLIDMTIRGILSEEEYSKFMMWHGYDHTWSTRMLLASYWIPSFEELQQFVWRGLITEEELVSQMRLKGVVPRYADYYKDLTWRIPGPSDLIRFVVREVITPDDFKDWMRKQGYNEYWSDAYWEAHWELPSFSNLRDAFWRGIISEEEFKKYVVWHDYKPDPRPGISKSDLDIMFELTWDPPEKLDARWMYRWGIINKEELLEIAKYRGVHPDWRDKVVEAWIKNEYMSDINRVVEELQDDYVEGFWSDDDFRSALKELGIRDEEIEYRLQEAKRQAIRYFNRDVLKTLQSALEKGLIDEPTFSRLASDYGVQEWKINEIIEVVRLKRMLGLIK